MTGSEPQLHVWIAITAEERRAVIAARHALFCLGLSGEKLERCSISPGGNPGEPHDEFDRQAAQFAVSVDGSRHSSDIVATTRLILGGSLDRLPTGRLLSRLAQPAILTSPQHRYAEASRFGMDARYQSTKAGRRAQLRLIGLQVETAVERGFDGYVVSLRHILMSSLGWFPWNLGAPFAYPASEGGPVQEGPMWPATLNLHELALVAKELRRADVYPAMFPNGTEWFSADLTRPLSELRAMIAANRSEIRAAMAAWTAQELELAHPKPAP